ncbi:MAG TPA: hypothetical protein VJB13_05280 [Candidatus Nanoarchaeia archaeon]|nr:hypothetical protein [Candidatus Nanoarchaeia archaeon]
MVLELLDALYLVTLLFAFLTVVFGILAVNKLFGNKLKELFSDHKFFIFFFLLIGYALFAMGELTWYLTARVFEKNPSAGMPDFYWITGALFMLVSFAALSSSLHKEYGKTQNFFSWAAISSLLVGGVLLYAALADGTFLGYLYPLLTSLILILSANLLLYYKHLDSFEIHLLYLFFANIGFLGGDLLFSSWGASSILGALSNIFYIFAYGLSAFAFLTLLLKFYHHASEKSLPLR